MGEVALYVYVIILFLFTVINLFLTISNSLVIIRIFDLVKANEERYQANEEKKRIGRHLVDINTPQIPY